MLPPARYAYRAQHERTVEEALSAAVTALVGSCAPEPTAFLARQLAAQAGLSAATPAADTTEAVGREATLVAAEKALSDAVVAMCNEEPADPLAFLALHLADAAGIHLETATPRAATPAHCGGPLTGRQTRSWPPRRQRPRGGA